MATGVLDTGMVSGFPGTDMDSGRKGGFWSSACQHGLQYTSTRVMGQVMKMRGRDVFELFYLSYKNNSSKGDNELTLI